MLPKNNNLISLTSVKWIFIPRLRKTITLLSLCYLHHHRVSAWRPNRYPFAKRKNLVSFIRSFLCLRWKTTENGRKIIILKNDDKYSLHSISNVIVILSLRYCLLKKKKRGEKKRRAPRSKDYKNLRSQKSNEQKRGRWKW